MGAKKLCQFILKKTTLLLFQFSIYEGEKNEAKLFFYFAVLELKACTFPSKSSRISYFCSAWDMSNDAYFPFVLVEQAKHHVEKQFQCWRDFFLPILPFQLSSDTRSWLRWQHWHFLGGTCSALEFPLLLTVLCQSCCWKLDLQKRYFARNL